MPSAVSNAFLKQHMRLKADHYNSFNSNVHNRVGFHCVTFSCFNASSALCLYASFGHCITSLFFRASHNECYMCLRQHVNIYFFQVNIMLFYGFRFVNYNNSKFLPNPSVVIIIFALLHHFIYWCKHISWTFLSVALHLAFLIVNQHFLKILIICRLHI